MVNLYKDCITDYLPYRMTVQNFIDLVNSPNNFDMKKLDKLIKEDIERDELNKPYRLLRNRKRNAYSRIRNFFTHATENAGNKNHSNIHTVSDLIDFFKNHDFKYPHGFNSDEEIKVCNELWKQYVYSLDEYIQDSLNQSSVKITFESIEKHLTNTHVELFKSDEDLHRDIDESLVAKEYFIKQLSSILD